jgi:AraC-like DNA-binding protein
MVDTDAPPPIHFEFAPPAPALAPALLIYWEVSTSLDEAVTDQMHPDWANIRFKLSGDWEYGSSRAKLAMVHDFATITGPTSVGQWARVTKGSGFNATLLPLAWLRLPGGDASAFTNRIRPLGALLGDDAAVLANDIAKASSFAERVAVTNRYFGALWAHTPPHPREAEIAAIDASMLDPSCATVEDLMLRTGLPQHSLMRLTKRAYGLSSKLLLRRERFLRMLRTMEIRSFQEWPDFLDPQYVDQSHMIRDFKYFLGLSPSQYFKLSRPMLESSLLAMQKLWAAGLDPLNSAPK